MPLNQPSPYRELVYPFNNRGVIQRIDPAMLEGGQYLVLHNMVSWQEGALRSRNGYRLYTPSGIPTGGSPLSSAHTVFRLYTGSSDPKENLIYVGGGDLVYRMTSEDPPQLLPCQDTGDYYAADLNSAGGRRRWTAVPYAKSASGKPYLYIASSGRMLKDQLLDTASRQYESMYRWGIDRPVWPVQVHAWDGGNLKSLFAPYSYVYTFRNPITGHESNPCPLMMDRFHIETDPEVGANVEVWCKGISPSDTDPVDFDWQLRNGYRNIVLYRAGGAFADGLYRRVAVLNWNGFEEDVYFVDNVADSDIASNPVCEWDNDRPVTSSLPTPFYAVINTVEVTVPGYEIVGQVEVTITVQQGLEEGEPLSKALSPGTVIRVGVGTDHEEFCVVGCITGDVGTYKFTTCFQATHEEMEVIQTASRANTPCRYAAEAFNSIFLAGDANNPHTLYKSKTGRPEAFPAVINEADGSPGSIVVGSPSNPIMNITEFGGYLLCLNKSKIYAVSVYNGAMQAPVETAAQRGLIAPWAWCKADNELYYMAYDGVYAFSGGQSVKKSEAIDHIFRGEYSNGFYPINFSEEPGVSGISPLEAITFWYRKNEVFISYYDLDGERRRLRYHTIYDRWSTEDVRVDAAYLEQDTGRLLFSQFLSGGAVLGYDDSPVTPSAPSTTDAWTSPTQDDGTEIEWRVRTGWMHMGQPAMQKHFGDLVLELSNPDTEVVVDVYYDFSDTPHEQFRIPPRAGRYRQVLPLNCSLGKEAWAVSLELSGLGKQPTSLYSVTGHFLLLEEIQRGRSTDWDNLGHPHDKRLQQLSLEYDTLGEPIELNLDVIYGVEPTKALGVMQFTLQNELSTDLTGPLRARKTFPINLDQPVKLVRLRTSTSATDFKNWTYHFDFIPYPPDQVLFTEWDSLGYPCEKILRELIIEIDTGGVPCKVEVQADGETARRFEVQTTWDSRHQIITLNEAGREELIGKQFRLLLTPGPGGKSQLFNHTFNAVRLPCVQTFFSTYEQTFGYNGYKFVKQIWIQYDSRAEVILRVYTDGRQLLYERTLPRHDRRDVERVYLPAVSSSGVLNKSVTYTVELHSTDPCCGFRIYADASRLEWMPVAADMRMGYQQFSLMCAQERTQML